MTDKIQNRVPVIFGRGLQNSQQFETYLQDPLTAKMLQKELGDGFDVSVYNYQTVTNPNSDYDAHVEGGVAHVRAQQEKYGHRGIIIGSSFGAQVMADGLDYYENQPNLLLVGPILYARATIERLPGGKQGLAALDAGQIAALPISVSSAEGAADAGKFMMGKGYLGQLDQGAVAKLFTATPRELDAMSITTDGFGTAFDYPGRMMIIAGKADEFAPQEHLEAYANLHRSANGQPADIVLVDGGHNASGDMLAARVKLMAKFVRECCASGNPLPMRGKTADRDAVADFIF